jgi:hypothetical protein
MAMMAMTTSSSMRVNPGDLRRGYPLKGNVFIGVGIGIVRQGSLGKFGVESLSPKQPRFP